MTDQQALDQLNSEAARIGVRVSIRPAVDGDQPRRAVLVFERGGLGEAYSDRYGHCDYQFQAAQIPFSGMTGQDVADIVSIIQNAVVPGEPEILDMNIFGTDLFKYLQGEMIGEKTISLTILNVTMEDVAGGGSKRAEKKPVLHFKERDKTLILNKTNAVALAERLGPETDNWRGATVTLSAPIIDAFGKQKRAVRVASVTPPAPLKGQPAPVAQEQPALVDMAGSEYND